VEGCGRFASTCIAINYVNLPAHIGMCETVIVDNIRPCGIGSDFQDGWVTCKKIVLHTYMVFKLLLVIEYLAFPQLLYFIITNFQ